MRHFVENIVEHIGRLVRFDRVMCSEGYDRALDDVARHLTCPSAWLTYDVFAAGETFWGWTVPSALTHWRDQRVDPVMTIPNDRPMRVLHVRVPGKVEAEILFVSHLCHPAPGANDNASGPAMMMELIHYYAQHPPHFSLRFLFTVEYWGTVAFCARHESALSGIIGGISLDMVGASQDVCGSTMIIDEMPDHLASCLDLSLWRQLQIASRAGNYRLVGNPVTAFRCDFQYYTGGSDHYVLNDASVGIPSTAINTYPDRFYHTPDDTPDKISPETLHLFFSTIVDGLAAFGDATERGTQQVAQLVLRRYGEVSHELMLDARSPGEVSPEEQAFRLGHAYHHAVARLNSLITHHPAGRLVPWSGILEERFVQQRKEFALCVGQDVAPPEFEDRARYRKMFKGPLSRNRLYERISPAEKSRLVSWQSEDGLFFHKVEAALNYSPQRGLAEIVWLLRLHYGGGLDETKLRWTLDLLHRYGLVDVAKA
jgi:hypothetical protein